MNNKDFLEEIEKIQKSYKRGMLSDSEVKTWIDNTIIDAFKEFYSHGRFERHIDHNSFNRFTDDYKMWKDQDKPCSLTGTPWLIDKYEDCEASYEKKKEFFEIIDMFHIPITYFEPIPAEVVRPDCYPGHYPGEIIVGWEIWKSDEKLFLNELKPGSVVELTDHRGFKSVLRIVKHNREEDKNRQNGEYDYLAMGTLEGYTSSRERKVRVYVRDGKISHLTTVRDNDDFEAFLDFPLWKDYHSYTNIKERIRQEVINKILLCISGT